MYALRIKDSDGYTVVEHVANYSDEVFTHSAMVQVLLQRADNKRWDAK